MKDNFVSKFAYLFSSNLLSIFLGVFLSIFIARYLGPSDLGLKSILTNFPILFVSFFEMGVRQSTIYFIGKQTYKLDLLFSNILSLWALSSIIGLGAFFILSYFQFSNYTIILITLSASYIPISIGQSFLNGILVGKNMIRSLAVFNFLNAILVPILTVIFLFFFDLGVLGVLLASQAGALFLLGSRIWILKNQLNLTFKLKIDLQIIKNLFSKGVLYAISLFLSSNLKIIPIFLMTGRIDNYWIGIYSAGSAFALLLYNFINSMGPILFARSAESNDGTENSIKTQLLLRVVIPILSILAIILILLMKFIIPIMYGNVYNESIPVTQIMIVGFVFYSVCYFLGMDMAGKGKPQIQIKSLILPFAICIVLNYFSISALGVIGAAYSTSIALIIATIFYLFQYTKELNTTIVEVIRPRKSDWVFFANQIKSIRK
jgi:O-antigen/teichoic acid export membrane protein